MQEYDTVLMGIGREQRKGGRHEECIREVEKIMGGEGREDYGRNKVLMGIGRKRKIRERGRRGEEGWT